MTSPPLLPFKSLTYQAIAPGPRLIVLGAVHGNEQCGTRAIQHLTEDLDKQRLLLQRGQLTLVPVANPLAYQQNTRNGERNLNRNFSQTSQPGMYEDHVANWLAPLLQAHDVLLDLHSFQANGKPFSLIGPPDNQGTLEPFAHAAKEERLAKAIGADRVLHGWLATYARGVERRLQQGYGNPLCQTPHYGVGTTEFMRQHGGYAITVECGQHDAAHTEACARTAIMRTLAHLELIAAAPVRAHSHVQSLELYEVIDKLHADDQFVQPWKSFDPLVKGEPIGHRHNGQTITAPEDGFIVFPNPKAQAGTEWCYLARLDDRLKGTAV